MKFDDSYNFEHEASIWDYIFFFALLVIVLKKVVTIDKKNDEYS